MIQLIESFQQADLSAPTFICTWILSIFESPQTRGPSCANVVIKSVVMDTILQRGARFASQQSSSVKLQIEIETQNFCKIAG